MNASRLKTALVAAATAASAMLFAAPAYAVHTEDFQLDGDVNYSTCGTSWPTGISCAPPQHDDWDVLYWCPSTGALGALCEAAVPGAAAGVAGKFPAGNFASAIAPLVTEPANGSTFTQGGSKDEKDVTSWRWTDGSVPDKDDLVQAFGAIYDTQLYFGANRLAVNGDAQIGFWLLQNATALCTPAMVTAGTCATAGTFVGKDGKPVQHRIGDVLILSNFTQGGGSSNISVYKVVQTLNNAGLVPLPGTCPPGSEETSAGTGDICLKLLVSGAAGLNAVCTQQVGNPGDPGYIETDAACAATNGIAVPSLDPRFKAKSGPASKYPIVGLFEGGLDLVKLGLAGECFPSFLVETRSSQSITAVLKDFTLGQYQSCDSNVKTEIHLSTPGNPDVDIQCPDTGTCTPIAPGTSIYDKAIIAGTIGAPVPTGTVKFTIYQNGSCDASNPTTQTVNLSTGQVDGAKNTVTVFSSAVSGSQVTPAGVSFTAEYSGDSRYPASHDGCEFIDVSKYSPTLATTATQEVALGSPISDTATLTGGSNPTGNIAFSLYASLTDCTNKANAVFTDTKAVANGQATSATFTPTLAGTYYWLASYEGDVNNNSATHACGATGEVTIVDKVQPSIATTPKISVVNNDSATLSGLVGSGTLTPNLPTLGAYGSLTFRLYKGANGAVPTCAAGELVGGPFVVAVTSSNAATVYATSNTTALEVTADTKFRWTVTYSGDGNNLTASSDCTKEGADIQIIDLYP